MKTKLILFVLCIMIAAPATLNAQTFKTAGDYMQNIGDEYEKIKNDIWDYTNAVARGKGARKIENKRKELIKTVGEAKKKIAKMPDFEGNLVFRDTVVSCLQLNYYVLSEDFAKIVNMEEVSEQSYDAMEAYLLAKEIANEKLDMASERVKAQQGVFAADHNITLINEKDKISQKLEKAGPVFNYYNRIYLIYFKCYKQEAYMLEALQKVDMNAVEQNKNALISVCAETQKKLDTLKPFKGDGSLKTSCKKTVDFYKKEAEEKVPIQVDFYLKKENFDKKKAAIDSKSQSERTQKDVDEFNAAVKEFNDAVNKFNAVNNELNQTRTQLLNEWNQNVQNFLDKHVPKKG
ncbi:MAG: hypothetical protein V2A54_00960 [Bacteroidota bacterium]